VALTSATPLANPSSDPGPGLGRPEGSPSSPDAGESLRRAKFGVFALVVRLVALQLTILGGDIYLRRILQPADFGVFAIAQFALAFFAYFGDAGLGSVLIQQKDDPSQKELSSIWCLQMLLSVGLMLIVGLGAPYFIRIWPDLPQSSVWLLRALSLNLVLTAARVVPTMLMERHLQYGRLSVLEVLLTIPFYVTAIVLARMDLGVMALVGAVLVQGALGVVGAYIMRPWKPSLVLDRNVLRPILKFGASYQIKNVVGFLCGAIAPVYGGRTLGQTNLGFIDWAQRTAFFPLRLVEVMSRVSFPLFSRLQNDRKQLTIALERSIQICALATLLFVGIAFGLGSNLIHVLYTDKWLPALPVFYVYAAAISLGFLTPLIAPFFDGTGRPQVNARFSIAWTTAIVLIVPFTTPRWGTVGFAIGYCIPVVIGNIGMLVVLKKLIPQARLWPRARAAIAGCLGVAVLGHYVFSPWAQNALSFTVSVLCLIVVYLGVVFVLDRSVLKDAMQILPRRR
jgi:O-antigen/teichoic acid export membrane protein